MLSKAGKGYAQLSARIHIRRNLVFYGKPVAATLQRPAHPRDQFAARNGEARTVGWGEVTNPNKSGRKALGGFYTVQIGSAPYEKS